VKNNRPVTLPGDREVGSKEVSLALSGRVIARAEGIQSGLANRVGGRVLGEAL
jgi:hypothetical protein